MDKNNSDNVVSKVRQHFDHDAAKQILKEKYEAKMLFAAFGGMWKASPELLSTLHLFQYNEADKEAVLIDEYGNPCKVVLAELFDTAAERWQEQMNGWYNEFNELKRQR